MTDGTLATRLLAGTLAIELAGTVRAGYCGKLLAEHGADVVVVARPDAVPRSAGHSAWLDAGKRRLLLHTGTEEGAALLRRLLARADLLIEDRGPAGMVALGLEEDELERQFPRLVHVAITDLGSDGAWAERPSTDLIVAALSGLASINGFAGEPPLREPGEQTRILAGMFGALGALTAVVNREQTGRGQRVDASALESVASVLSPSFLQTSYQDAPPRQRRRGAELILRCGDGYISLTPYPDRAWETLCSLFGIETVPGDERFATETARRANADAVQETLLPALATRDRQELFETLCTMRVVCGMVMRPEELPHDPHLVERGGFHEREADGAVLPLPGPSFRVAGERPPPLPSVGDVTVEGLFALPGEAAR